MIIGFDYLLPRVRNNEIISNLAERELNNPEGAGFDLRADEIYRIKSAGFVGVTERETSEIELVGKYHCDETVEVTLEPNEYYLVKIIEEICLDSDMVGFFHPRSTLFRSGVVLQTGVQAPGYKGCPTFGIHVAGKYPFRLEMGARVAHINILRIDGDSSNYRGQWQGGRVTTEGKEDQV